MEHSRCFLRDHCDEQQTSVAMTSAVVLKTRSLHLQWQKLAMERERDRQQKLSAGTMVNLLQEALVGLRYIQHISSEVGRMPAIRGSSGMWRVKDPRLWGRVPYPLRC